MGLMGFIGCWFRREGRGSVSVSSGLSVSSSGGSLVRDGLGNQAEFGSFESMGLGHGIFGAGQAIEDEFAEEWIAYFTLQFQVLFAIVIYKV